MEKRNFETQFSRRRKIVGVMGGSTDFPELTAPLGQLIAQMGFHLLTGAGEGVMEAVSRAFSETPSRQGSVIGIVRANPDVVQQQSHGNPRYCPKTINRFVEIPIYTHLRQSNMTWDSRNHINVLTADVVVVLPGSTGTESEVMLALEYEVPTIFFLGKGSVNNNAADRYVPQNGVRSVVIAADMAQVEAAIKKFLS